MATWAITVTARQPRVAGATDALPHIPQGLCLWEGSVCTAQCTSLGSAWTLQAQTGEAQESRARRLGQ